ncbi:MAG: molybdenum cofactor biosynthesis protein A [Bacteroidia bacterium]|jgi:molybdenum cofactor biosynthesis protein A
MGLIDAHGRQINYVRLAVTDRCNLRCTYCMPQEGIDFVQRDDLLRYEEMLRMLKIFKTLGVTKLRITGGEPLVRKDLLQFLSTVSEQHIMDGFHLTTNATITLPHIDRLISSGLKSVNISLDTLDKTRFFEITRRDHLYDVLASINAFYQLDIPIKINMVVSKGVNDIDIIPMAQLAQHRNIQVRFLEEMPFNGTDETKTHFMTHHDIKSVLNEHLPELTPVPFTSGETSQNYNVAGWKGDVGIIASYSRTFCGTCNRVRVTPTGQLKTCLYGKNDLDLRSLLRNGSSDEEIAIQIQAAVAQKPKDGFVAESERFFSISESMASIGG